MADRDRCSANDCIEPAYIHDTDGHWCRTHWDEMEAAKHAAERQATEEAGGPWPQTCPRRGGEIGPWERGENLDTWDIREQMHKGLQARHCSFCGSLHPDDFMRLVKEGWQIGATDKSYKAYLGSPEGRSQETKFYFQHLSVEQRREFVDLYNAKAIRFSGGGFYRLPFFMVPAT
jgi:hypothetical protein